MRNADAIGDKIEELKKGRSEVLESGHTLILGWSDKSLNMIDQLVRKHSPFKGSGLRMLVKDVYSPHLKPAPSTLMLQLYHCTSGLGGAQTVHLSMHAIPGFGD